ncbi:MAG: hypothetical protein JWL61_5533 [Gemmatimonadetes bacterium]|nr:hypothetical protein [Gemmatimonadota bacterium]
MPNYEIQDAVGVIVTRRFASYQDQPGVLYHYPKARYHERIRSLQGKMVLVYEPKRGGTSPESPGGGRSAFIGTATLGEIWEDPHDPSNSFVETREYCEFPFPVRVSDTTIPGKTLQNVVVTVASATAAAIISQGFAIVLDQDSARHRHGLVDLVVSEDITARQFASFTVKRAIRDASFRFRVVEQAYAGRCAFTGMRLTNGNGRAEVDAAHIRSVENGGPDSVRNGLALSRTMHWAFDRGLVSLADDGGIMVAQRGVGDEIRRLLRPEGVAILPPDALDHPHPTFLEWHRTRVFHSGH